jgi:Bacterial SH3 domain
MKSIRGIVVATVITVLVATPARSQGPTAQRGQTLFEALARHYPQVRPTVWEVATPTPAVALILPEGEWTSLDSEEQESLRLYVASLIPHVRAHPDRYLGALNEPLSADERAKLVTLCAHCWLIAVGPLTLDATGVLPDRVVVRGASTGPAESPPTQAATAAQVCPRRPAVGGPGPKAKRRAKGPRDILTISAGAGVKIRSGPGIGCPVIGVAKRGESFTLRGGARGWYAVDYHGSEGWVHRILW